MTGSDAPSVWVQAEKGQVTTNALGPADFRRGPSLRMRGPSGAVPLQGAVPRIWGVGREGKVAR